MLVHGHGFTNRDLRGDTKTFHNKATYIWKNACLSIHVTMHVTNLLGITFTVVSIVSKTKVT